MLDHDHAHPTPLSIRVTVITDAPRTPAWDALWRRLLAPIPAPPPQPPRPPKPAPRPRPQEERPDAA